MHVKKGTVQGWHIQNNRRRCAALRATHDGAGKVDVDMDVPGERERERERERIIMCPWHKG